jgi:hypothetical protein
MAVKKIQHSDGHQQVWVRGRLEDRQTFACALQRGGAGGTVAHRVHRRSIGALSGAANCQLGVHCHPGLVSCNTDAITTNTPN